MKCCTKCGELKSFDLFAKDKQKADGYRSSCKVCNLEYRAAYYQVNREAAIQESRNWYASNKGKAAKAMRKWVEVNKDKANVIWRNRRARKREADGTHSIEDVERMRSLQKNKCACCHADLNKSGFHVDHVVALASGGSNDVSNLQILCPTCNLKKGCKNPIDFMQEKGFLC